MDIPYRDILAPLAKGLHVIAQSLSPVARTRGAGVPAAPTISQHHAPLNPLSAVVAIVALLTSPAIGQVIRPTNGPFGGIVAAIVIAPSTPTIIYAGTYVGVYRSMDGGETWATTVPARNLGLVNALAVDPRTADTVYAGTATGVFKTMDGGATWFSVANSAFDGVEFSQGVLSLAIDSTNPDYVYAGTPKGVFHTFNGGVYWSGGGTQPAPALAMIPASFPTGLPTVFVGGRDGVSGFTADGLTDVTALALDSSHTTLYAGTRAGRIFKCTIGVFEWQDVSPDADGGAVTALATDAHHADWVYAATAENGVWRTRSAGARWEPLTAGTPVSPYVFSLAVDAAGGIRAGTWNGIFTSPDRGDTWNEANDGLAAPVVSTLAIASGSPIVIYAGSEYGGMFKSTDWGEHWVTIDTGLPGPSCQIKALVVDPVDSHIAYLGCRGDGVVFKTTDGGASWTGYDGGLAVSRVDALAIDPEHPTRLYAGTNGGVFVSNTSGVSWVRANPGLAYPVATLTVVPSRPGQLYAGTMLGNGAYVSVDQGQHWTKVWKGLDDVSFRALDLDLLAAGGSGVAYCGNSALGAHLYTTTTGSSAGWAQFAPESLVAATLALNPRNASDLYVGTTSGTVVTTKDMGRTAWEPVWESLHPIRALAVDPADAHRVLVASDIVTEIYQGVPPSPTPTATPRPPTRTPTASATASSTQTITETRTPSHTITATPSGSATLTRPPTWTASPVPTSTVPPSPAATATPIVTITLTRTPTTTETAIASATPTLTTLPTTPTWTATTTATASQTNTATASHTPIVATPTSAIPCAGDCDGDRVVTVDELIEGVRMSLGQVDVDACQAFDPNGDGGVTIEELIAGVRAALGGCHDGG